MRTVFVVPMGIAGDLLPHGVHPQRNQQPIEVLLFQRPDKSFDDGDAAVFANRPKAGLYCFTLAPSLKARVPELNSFVADKVFGRGAHFCNTSPYCIGSAGTGQIAFPVK